MDPCKSKITEKDQVRFFKQRKTQLIVSLNNRYHYYYDGESNIFFFLLWRVSPLVPLNNPPSMLVYIYIYMMKPQFTGDNSIIQAHNNNCIKQARAIYIFQPYREQRQVDTEM